MNKYSRLGKNLLTITEKLKNIADDEQLLEMNKSISEKLYKLRQFMYIDFLTETIYRQDKHEEV